MHFLPQMKSRCTRINRKKNLTQRRQGAEFFLCALAPLRELFSYLQFIRVHLIFICGKYPPFCLSVLGDL